MIKMLPHGTEGLCSWFPLAATPACQTLQNSSCVTHLDNKVLRLPVSCR